MVAVTILTLVRGTMTFYHRHIKVYTCFHLFGHTFGFVSCSEMHSPRDSSLKQIILKIRNLETDLPTMVGKSWETDLCLLKGGIGKSFGDRQAVDDGQ